MRNPACAARGWLVATAPPNPMTTERREGNSNGMTVSPSWAVGSLLPVYSISATASKAGLSAG